MLFRIGADIVLILHLAFVLFVVAGAFLVLRFPALAWLHVPAAAWGVYVELAGRVCPLTTLENYLLRNAGSEGYSISFIEHYLVPLLYPAGLTPRIQFSIAAMVALINGAAYAWILYSRWKK